VAGRKGNLKPWKPGQSGNPGGRPKRDLAAEIARAIFEHALGGDYPRTGGGTPEGERQGVLLRSPIEHTASPGKQIEFAGADGGPVQTNIVVQFVSTRDEENVQ
jgi:hypothetical protein